MLNGLDWLGLKKEQQFRTNTQKMMVRMLPEKVPLRILSLGGLPKFLDCELTGTQELSTQVVLYPSQVLGEVED